MTPRALQVLDFICAYKRRHDGNSPSIRQIGDSCSIPSTSTAWYYLDQLEKSGKIKSGKSSSRSIEVLGGHWSKS